MPVDTPTRAHTAYPGTTPLLSAMEPAQAPPQAPAPPSYYDVSMLKAPVWKWEIASYFFLGGVSAGAYILSRLADRFGGGRFRRVRQAGAVIAAAAAAPCAPLLIKDLGDPKRFHHMLRVWKPQSPMNLGAWTLTAYSGAAFLAALREWRRRGQEEHEAPAWGRVTDGLVVAVTDAAGIPLAVLLAGYTGVLLSGTSTPVWSRNPWLGPLFSASAIATGTAAVNLAVQTFAGHAAHEPLDHIETAAHLAEALALAGFHAAAGRLAQPLTQGKMAGWFWSSVAATAASEVLKHLASPGAAGRWLRLAASVLDLAGGFAQRWAFVHAGRLSADDPDAARWASRPTTNGTTRA